MIDPTITDVVTILGLQPHPAFAATQANRLKIHFGIDSEVSGVKSYRFSAEELRTLLGVADSAMAVNVVATGHSIPPLVNGVPWPVYVGPGNVVTQANTTSVNSLPTAYVVAIPDANTLTIQLSGPLLAPGHGLTTGKYYYLQDNGSLSLTPDAQYNSRVLYAWNADTLLLQHVRHVAAQPSVYFINSLSAATVVGAQYRLRAAETVGTDTFTAGIYMVDEDSKLIQLHVLPDA